MSHRPNHYTDVEKCVEETLKRVGKKINLGTPLGIGKANHIVNEFYRRASADPSIRLRILTALSLGPPDWSSDLERRFVEPIVERLFGGYEELSYVEPVKNGDLPDNIEVQEFYFQPGGFMKSRLAQRYYVSSNYTHAVRDLMDNEINVLAQLVSKGEIDGSTHYSLSSNTDLTVDIMPLLEQERSSREIATLAQVNPNLPFMYGDAAVEPSYFDAVLDAPEYEFSLFGVPNSPVSTADYMIALGVSTLIPDGGTVQVGIGSLGDALTAALQMRHEQNRRYHSVLGETRLRDRYTDLIGEIGGTGRFEEGLYASSEMLIDGFLELYESDILKREVYDHVGIQRLVNAGAIGPDVDSETLETLVQAGVISTALDADDVELLQEFGILREDISFDDGSIVLGDGERVSTDLTNDEAKDKIIDQALGDQLQGGHVAHASFFLGPAEFYESLRNMPHSDRAKIRMSGISFVNELYGREALKRAQRKDARFINTGLIATLSGAVASDGLEDGRVISGVGGQYNFVAMAQELDDGRSILMIRSTRKDNGSVTSNIRFNYGHITIPRHLRDIVVTEYGIADLRGKTDEQVATALIEIADSRFQEKLLKQAKNAGKVSDSYRIPDYARNNRPGRLDDILSGYRSAGHFQRFPFDTDFMEEELTLKRALTSLENTLTGQKISLPQIAALRNTVAIPDGARPYLERMELDKAETLRERLMQRALVYALSSTGAL